MATARTDLRALFPEHRWRWTSDHEPGMHFDPWHVEIPCKYGAVYLHATRGGVVLQAWVTSVRIARRALALAHVRPHQVGEDEVTVLVPFRDAAPLLALLRARRKRLPSSTPPKPPRKQKGEAPLPPPPPSL